MYVHNSDNANDIYFFVVVHCFDRNFGLLAKIFPALTRGFMADSCYCRNYFTRVCSLNKKGVKMQIH